MKKHEKGFASILAILIIVVIAGGGFYVYKEYLRTQKNIESIQYIEIDTVQDTNVSISQNTELPESSFVSTSTSTVNTVVKSKITTKDPAPITDNVTLFEGYGGFYSFKYPKEFTRSAKQSNTFCSPDESKCITFMQPDPSVMPDHAIKESEDYKKKMDTVPKVVIGKNTFVVDKIEDNEIYYMYIGKIFDEPSYVQIWITDPNKFNRSDIDAILSSLKVNPFIGSVATNASQKEINDGQVKLDIAAFRRMVGVATSDYSDVCNTVSQENNFNFYEVKQVLEEAKKLMGGNVQCRGSKDSYVFYSRLSTGLYACSDGKNYHTDLKTGPKEFSCK